MAKSESTKYRLAEAMKTCMKTTSVDDITIRQIVEVCGVTRQTFYRNFLDKYDLINWYFDKLLLKSFEHMGEGTTVYDGLVKKFEYLKEEHLFFAAAFRSDDQNSLKEHDFDFWVNRIGWASKIFDITRIDHFRAFDSYWDIPSNFTTAANGYWRYAPGYELFDCLYDKLGDIELVAEDLGYLRKEVVELKDHYGLKGMKVFQFMSIDELEELSECFFYPGTHDNETLKGWIEGLDDYQVESYRSYFKSDLPLNQAIISYCLHSDASDVIIPIWDLLEVNNDQRFNVPGEVNDINWTYRVPEIDLVKKGLALFFKLRKEGQDEFKKNKC